MEPTIEGNEDVVQLELLSLVISSTSGGREEWDRTTNMILEHYGYSLS